MNKILIGIKPDTVEGINNDLKLLVNIILPQIRHVLKIEVDNFIILNNGKINPQILASSNLISHLYFGNKNRHSCIKNYSNRNWIFFRVKTSLTFQIRTSSGQLHTHFRFGGVGRERNFII